MQCRTCNYSLWNLRTRTCPECGTGFRPSEFEFEPNTVRFCCTGCGQAYYGTSYNGHLRPSSFACVSCGTAQQMDDMVLLPAQGLADIQTRQFRMAWTDRQSVGFVRAWWKTLVDGMLKPAELMRASSGAPATIPGWTFFIVNLAIIFLAGTLIVGLFAVIISGFMGGAGGAGGASLGRVIAGVGIGGGVTLLVGLIGHGIYLSLWIALAHLLLKLTGPTKGRFGLSSQAFTYTSGALVLLGTICVWYIAYVWWLVCAVVALKEIQRVSWTRSVIAALTFPVLSAVGATVIYIVGMMQIFTTTTTLAGGFGMSLLAEAQTLSAGLDTYTRQRNGIYPAHAIELVDKDPNIVASDFVGPFTNTWTSDIPVGDTDLETYAVATGPARTAAYDAACDALPDDVIAHRVGDFVFTYHGLDGTMPPDAMWTLVGYPDPDTNATPTAGTLIAIGYADGSAREVRYSLFQTEFASQNVLRGTHGLPPIPPMHTILHGNPASGTVAVDGDETDAP